MNKKILLITLHFDDSHMVISRRNKLPQGMGAVFLAGAFNSHQCDLKVYSELYSGPLEDKKLLSWPDMVVLTGVTNCFDRMLQITAYVKSLNPKAIIVAGGPPIRIFHKYSKLFFDYCCTGDIEQLQEVILDAFGHEYCSDVMVPRLDLAYWIGIHGHAESTRNCNYNCDFCSLTGEEVKYRKYDLDYLRQQLTLMGKKRSVHFIDNNFYGNDREHFLARLHLIDEFRRKGQFTYWSALVAGDFFSNENNLLIAKKTGCVALYSGIESFDDQTLRRFHKNQSIIVPQTEIIRQTLSHGIAFWYGLILDIYKRPITDLLSELEYLFSNDQISLPVFLTLPVPLPGTPYFYRCMEQKGFLPNTSLRHIDGTTICMKPLAPLHETAEFVKNMKHLKGYKRKIIRHAMGFYKNYRKNFNIERLSYVLASNALLSMNMLFTGNSFRRIKDRTYISSSEEYEASYTPSFPVSSKYKDYFKPTMLTDKHGNITDMLRPDLNCYNNKNPAIVKKPEQHQENTLFN